MMSKRPTLLLIQIKARCPRCGENVAIDSEDTEDMLDVAEGKIEGTCEDCGTIVYASVLLALNRFQVKGN